jgi:hypothetical protein
MSVSNSRFRLFVFASVLALALAVVGSASAHSRLWHHGRGQLPHNARLDRIFVITLENHSRDGVIGDPNAPFITKLANRYGEAAGYYGVTHPSEPNYLAQIAGSNFGINNDNPANRVNAPNLVDQLEAHRLSWGAYMESMPSAGYLGDFYPGSSQPLYASKHNPFVFFEDIRNDPSRLAKVKPYDALGADLNSRHAPSYVYIVPNQCHDMHGGVYSTVASDGGDGTPCPYGNEDDDENDAALKQKADAFVRQTVWTIRTSRAWRTGHSAIFIVADESDYNGDEENGGWADASGCCDSPVIPAGGLEGVPAWPGGVYGGGLSPAVVVTDHGPRHYVSDTPYNHYSLLTTVEDNWRLGYLGHAGDAAGGVLPMSDLLGR